MKEKSLVILVAGLLIVLFGAGLIFKNDILDFISRNQIKTESKDLISNAEKQIRNDFNYTENGLDYQFTLLEFGSVGCVMCKQMEPVLEEIRQAKEQKINVVFLHTMKPENLGLMKYFGISAIPMQILLDKNGKEFFRNYGVISASEIYAEIKKTQIN